MSDIHHSLERTAILTGDLQRKQLAQQLRKYFRPLATDANQVLLPSESDEGVLNRRLDLASEFVLNALLAPPRSLAFLGGMQRHLLITYFLLGSLCNSRAPRPRT